MSKIFNRTNWSTIIDMEHKLIIYTYHFVKEFKVDETTYDPDGIPLIFIGHERVTRVRKMTEKEFEDAVKAYGMTYEINMIYAPEREKKNESTKKGMANKT